MTQNSFFHDVSTLHFGTYKPEDVAPALTTFEKQARDRVEAVLAIPETARTFTNTVQAFSESSEELDHLHGIVSHLAATLGEPWQDADTLATQKLSAYYAERSLDTRLYNACKIVAQQHSTLTPAQNRLLKDILDGFERGGIALPTKQKTRVKQISEELAELSTQFTQNVVKATDNAYLTIKNRTDLAGIDTDRLQTWQQAAKQKGVNGYYIHLSPPNYTALMTLCSVKTTRQAVHKISKMRAPENEPLALRMLALRQELATLLGFKTYADYTLADRMAKTGKSAVDFVESLTKSYKPVMERDAKELQAFARKDSGDPTYTIDVTDVDAGTPFYFASRLRAKQLGIDELKLREYFPIETVMEGMLDVIHTLYGLTFTPTDQPTFHPDAKAYTIKDEANKHIATVWCDWFARPGKQQGAWQHTIYVADRSGGKVDKPHLGFVCANFAGPTQNKPALLDLRDIETMWHEFGHFIHAALGRTELREHNGFSCTWDFIEAPSQIMENWVWEKEVLQKISSHYQTKQPLPDNIIDRLQIARPFRAASTAMYTLAWATLDLTLHTTFDPAKHTPLINFTHTIKSRFFPVPIAPYDAGICQFTHIFGGGYAAGYYGYLWAQSIEADLFSRFQKEGILNPATGRAYRDLILARGDSADPDVLIRDFLGRDSTPAAMLQRDGITK